MVHTGISMRQNQNYNSLVQKVTCLFADGSTEDGCYKKKSNVGDITKKITSNTVTLFSLQTITQHVIAVMHRGPQGRLRSGTRTLCTDEVTHAANLFSQDQNTFRHQNQI